jgi:CheY-like chemotaxis protein
MGGEAFRTHQLADPLLATIPVVIMTASELRDLSHLGATELIKKPFSFDELFRKLGPWIQSKAG